MTGASSGRRFATRAVHAGQEPEPTTGAVVVPIYQTSTYHQPRLGEHRGYQYARADNPTRGALETNLAALEGARHGFAFGSGMAAINAVADLLAAGDHVVASADMYGGTYRIFESVFRRFQIRFDYVDSSDVGAVEAALRPETRMLFVESPSNPCMRVTDLAGIAGLGRQRGAWTVCDNTFMTPYFQRPLELGIDLVVHSTTKYLNGHSDAVGGAVLVNDEALAARIKAIRNATGGIPGPMDCWLVMRGIKTLALRMERHQANARAVAAFLAEQPVVEALYYPGRREHPGHELMRQQCSGFGGMLAIDLGTEERARSFLASVRIFTLAESLGGVESLVCHPATMTHAFLAPAERERLGIGPGLVRLSVGIEDVEDLIADLAAALASSQRSRGGTRA